jgi:hypothetical protein
VGHLCIQSSLHTLNGTALVTDVKRLVQESEERSVLVQELSIVNQQTGASHTTIRYFNPYTDIPPHLIPAAPSDVVGAAVDG